MNKEFLKDAFGWGFLLWLVGYGLSIILFSIVPLWVVGWVMMPIGTVVALWVLFKKIRNDNLGYYAKLALVWTLLAAIFDYLFIVKAFNPADGYYKLDVYLYYALTFLLPLTVGWRKSDLIKTK